MRRFASSADPYGRFTATGSSSRRGLDAERALKEHQRGVIGGQGRGAEAFKKEEKKKDAKKNNTKQKEGQYGRDPYFWGRDGGRF